MKVIGAVLLALGTALAGLGAANAERSSRNVAVADATALKGQVLYDSVTLDDKGTDDPADDVTLARDSEVDDAAIAKLEAAGIESVTVRYPPRDSEMVTLGDAPGRVLTTEIKLPGDAKPLRKGRYLDDEAMQALEQAKIASVPVKISRDFAFGRWGQAWLFGLGILVMLAGVFLTRQGMRAAVGGGGGADAVTAETMRTWLETFESSVEQLAHGVDTMECDEIHHRLDPLFVEFGQPFVEHREVLRVAFGGAGFANILGPFASAERRLNRAWSAAVDGYPDEARAQVKAAGPYLQESLEAFPRA